MFPVFLDFKTLARQDYEDDISVSLSGRSTPTTPSSQTSQDTSTPSSEYSFGSSSCCQPTPDGSCSCRMASEKGFGCCRLRDDEDRFVHVNKWFADYDTDPCSKTEVIYLTHCFRSEEPVTTNMDISTGHIVLVGILLPFLAPPSSLPSLLSKPSGLLHLLHLPFPPSQHLSCSTCFTLLNAIVV